MIRDSRATTGNAPKFAYTVGQSRTRAWITKGPFLALGFAALVGCSGAGGAGTTENVGATSEAIYGGAIDNDPSATTGVVALRIGDSSPFELCSGSLIAPNVVLTARHCISKSIVDTVYCDAKGLSTNGDHVGADVAPASIRVYTGSNPSFATPAAVGKAIFHPAGKVLCNSDIAVIVLDTAVPAMAPLTVRLDAVVKSGEPVRSVGYGKNDAGYNLGTRFRKEGVDVLAVGSGISSSATALGTLEFEVGKSICQGDSGGPAISEVTGAVVGVVSRGGGCGDAFGHVYTQPSGFQDLINDAFAMAGGAPMTEGSTQPATAPTAPQKPAANAADDSTAPHGASCSMSAAPSSRSNAGLFGLVFGALLLFRRRSN
jgi:MYXO-CTERM domain-containing protein